MTREDDGREDLTRNLQSKPTIASELPSLGHKWESGRVKGSVNNLPLLAVSRTYASMMVRSK